MSTGLAIVEIETHTYAKYIFPDVPRGMLETVVLKSAWQENGTFVLVNVSGASLSLPSRIVKTIIWDGKVQVARDGSSVHEL